jgi:type VI secretion system protein ImpK
MSVLRLGRRARVDGDAQSLTRSPSEGVSISQERSAGDRIPSDQVATQGQLAGALQEALTAIVRLRSDRQPVSDATAFRTLMKQLLARAQQDALGLGYGAEDVRLAIFAAVVYLDESVLNARVPVFADWPRRPLQDELFGGHMGGEWFFQYLEQLLQRPDSTALGDLLEVYLLCLLLGFRGRYGAGGAGDLHAITSMVATRVARIRGTPGDLAPAWRPPSDTIDERDPWLPRLTRAAIATAVLTIVAWGSYTLLLRSQRAEIRSLVPAAGAAMAVRS